MDSKKIEELRGLIESRIEFEQKQLDKISSTICNDQWKVGYVQGRFDSLICVLEDLKKIVEN